MMKRGLEVLGRGLGNLFEDIGVGFATAPYREGSRRFYSLEEMKKLFVGKKFEIGKSIEGKKRVITIEITAVSGFSNPSKIGEDALLHFSFRSTEEFNAPNLAQPRYISGSANLKGHFLSSGLGTIGSRSDLEQQLKNQITATIYEQLEGDQ